MTLANYLYALIYSDIYDKEKWQMWGEQLLNNANYDENTEWVFNLVFSNSKKSAFEAISGRRFEEDYLSYNNYTLTEIIQGYYYFQYKEGKMCLYDLLDKSGDVADAGEDSIGCEFFYDLLNQIDLNPDIVNNKEFIGRIDNYFYPLYESALEQKSRLESCGLKDLNIDIH